MSRAEKKSKVMKRKRSVVRTSSGDAQTGKKAEAKVANIGRTTKTTKELRDLRAKFALGLKPKRGGVSYDLEATSPAGACWFKDPGGSDQCIPATQADCQGEGGVWTPGNCTG
jgi:hypothetical protein